MPYLTSLRSLAIALMAIVGTAAATVVLNDQPLAQVYVTPVTAAVELGSTITFDVVVESRTAVNAFTGELVFASDNFRVSDISYNTSIADLWVEEPWYNRSSNSIYFAGGTTAPGGFSGEGALLSITLTAYSPGDTLLELRNVRVLAHDGLGSDVSLAEPLDALFTVDISDFMVPTPTPAENYVSVVPRMPALDVNADGRQNFQDISTLLINFGSSEAAYDFTGDGTVSWADIRVWQDLHRATE